MKLWVGAQQLVAEVARKPDEIATGLMFRTNLRPDEAMLFLLPVPQRAQFYMRNTPIALSCAYMDDEWVIQEIHDMQPRDETPIPSTSVGEWVNGRIEPEGKPPFFFCMHWDHEPLDRLRC